MPMQQFIGRLQSPNLQVVVEIALAHSGLVLTRHQAIPFPAGICQLWEFGPYTHPCPPSKETRVEPRVVAVFFKDKTVESWKTLDMDFDQAVMYYRHQARLREPISTASLRSLPALPPGLQAVLPPFPRYRGKGGET